MKTYAIVPLSSDEKTLNALKKGLQALEVKTQYPPPDETLHHIRFVGYEGTPTELSKAIVKHAEEEYIPHLVIGVSFSIIAGQGPTDFVQWAKQYVD